MALLLDRLTGRARPFAALGVALAASVLVLWALLAIAPGRAQAGGPQPTPSTATVPLNSSHEGSLADGFGEKDCSDFAPAPDADQDGWHFVIPGSGSPTFLSLTLVFEYPDGAQFAYNIVAGPATDQGYIKASQPKHAYVYTSAGVELVSGSAQVQGAGEYPKFNLSHTCSGEVPETETPCPTETPRVTPHATKTPHVTRTPRVTETPEVPPSSSSTPLTATSPAVTTSPTLGVAGSAPSLPLTGTAIAGYIVGGGALLALGALLLVAARRKKAFATQS
jgi:LPXTG-motif cell wall-anchored protein